MDAHWCSTIAQWNTNHFLTVEYTQQQTAKEKCFRTYTICQFTAVNTGLVLSPRVSNTDSSWPTHKVPFGIYMIRPRLSTSSNVNPSSSLLDTHDWSPKCCFLRPNLLYQVSYIAIFFFLPYVFLLPKPYRHSYALINTWKSGVSSRCQRVPCALV